MNLVAIMEKILSDLLASAEKQYQSQLDTLQREHARHIADIRAGFGLREAEYAFPSESADQVPTA